MDRFSDSLGDAQLRSEFHGAIRGAGVFRSFKRLLTEFNLRDAWNRFRQAELRQIAMHWCKEHGITLRQKQS
jgi:hypothetical protein